MSNCRDIVRESLPEYVNGNLDPEGEAKVTDHLATCPDCVTDVNVLRQLKDELLPDPATWFFEGLPGKVTAEIEVRRKRKQLILIPAWAGGLALAVFAAIMFILPGAEPDFKAQIQSYAAAKAEGSLPLGFEAEILEISSVFVNDLDKTIIEDLDVVSEDVFVPINSIFENDVYEIMDAQTMRIFESLVEEMVPESIGKKVMS